MENSIQAFVPDGPITDEMRAYAEKANEASRLVAAVNFNKLLGVLTEAALDPAATFKSKLDAAELNYKTAGLAAKQEAKSEQGLQISIVLPGSGQTVSFGGTTIDQNEENAFLNQLPTYISDLVVRSDE